MNTSLEVESLMAGTQPLVAAAANEEFDGLTKQVAGWDPYEVWRTRIRQAVQNDMQGGVVAS